MSKKGVKKQEYHIELNQEFYKSLIDNIEDGIYFVDTKRTILYWNKGAEKISGFQSKEVVGKHCWDNILMHVDEKGVNLCQGLCPLVKAIKKGEKQEENVYLRHKNGHRVPVSIKAIPIRDSEGKIVGAVEVFNTRTPEDAILKRLKALKKLALIDPLTGIANRRYIEMYIKNKLTELKRNKWDFGILFVDIDHFKQINDRYGHNIGDRVLKMVAKTLEANLRPFDFVGRWGGEEFIIVISNIKDKKQLYSIAERLRILVAQSWFSVGKNTIKVTVSIGGTVAKPDDTFNSLIKRADRLMYKSKIQGRNCISIEI